MTQPKPTNTVNGQKGERQIRHSAFSPIFFKKYFTFWRKKKCFAIMSLCYLCLPSLPFPKIREIQPEGLSLFFLPKSEVVTPVVISTVSVVP
jgi:hypothetical protein